MSDLPWYQIVAIAGLAGMTVLTRAFFLIPEKEVPIPAWLREALRYAPLAALVAVVLPEIILSQGHLLATWQDARPYAALAGGLWFWWRRGMLGTILCGTAVLLTLKLGLGW
jgi:branched-subunit amino acid transport protein